MSPKLRKEAIKTGDKVATGPAINAPTGSSIDKSVTVKTPRAREAAFSTNSLVSVIPRKTTSRVNATVSNKPAFAPAMNASPSTTPSIRMNRPGF